MKVKELIEKLQELNQDQTIEHWGKHSEEKISGIESREHNGEEIYLIY